MAYRLIGSWFANQSFSFNEQPQIKAYMVHSALLSSLQMNKVLRNDVYKSIQAGLLSI